MSGSGITNLCQNTPPKKNIEGGAGSSNYEMGKMNDVEFDKTIT